jgi:hypothetical protein
VDLVELTCKRCGAAIREVDVDAKLGLAKCSHCGTVFALAGLPRPQENDAAVRQRLPVPMPKELQVSTSGGALQITRRWFSAQYVFLIFFAVVWNGFMVFWHVMAWSSGSRFMSLFGLLHTGVGLFLIYYTLAGLVNRTEVRVESGRLSVEHYPLPWPGGKQVQAAAIKQIYCTERVNNTKNGVRYRYEVHAVMGDSAKEKLLDGLNDPEQALYIEQELERYLGIQDQAVRGELPR